MRETLGSMRAYLILSGVMTTGSAVMMITNPQFPIWFRVIGLISACFGVCFFGTGIRFKTLIASSGKAIMGMFAVFLSFQVVLFLIMVDAGLAINGPVIGFVIGSYLLYNTRRLARETETPADEISDAEVREPAH